MTYAPRSRAARTVGAYANVGLESEIMGAAPERLISLLFRGALTATARARLHMGKGQTAERGLAISKAIDIVETGLKASLDAKRGGDVTRHLLAAYDLIVANLLQANLRNDLARLDAAEKLLADLADAWRTAVDPQFEQPLTH